MKTKSACATRAWCLIGILVGLVHPSMASDVPGMFGIQYGTDDFREGQHRVKSDCLERRWGENGEKNELSVLSTKCELLENAQFVDFVSLLGTYRHGSGESAAASRPRTPPLLHLKVDFAPPSSQTDPQAVPNTAKPGWWHWVMRGNWDFYRSDLTWENGTPVYSADGPGIAGSGVHAAITCHYEGLLSYYVAGMKRYLAGGLQPEGQPIYEPICNSWVAASDFPNNPSSDLLLALYDLPAGSYRLVSYHNSFNCHRVGDDPTGVQCGEARQPEPPMPSIKVYSLKTIVSDYFGHTEDAEVKGKAYGTSQTKLVLADKRGTGKVEQTKEARNVVIQQVTTDSELKPSVIEFTTDGSPVVVVYTGGSGKRDDLRPHRRGGYAVLNAFELVQLSDLY